MVNNNQNYSDAEHYRKARISPRLDGESCGHFFDAALTEPLRQKAAPLRTYAQALTAAAARPASRPFTRQSSTAQAPILTAP